MFPAEKQIENSSLPISFVNTNLSHPVVSHQAIMLTSFKYVVAPLYPSWIYMLFISAIGPLVMVPFPESFYFLSAQYVLVFRSGVLFPSSMIEVLVLSTKMELMMSLSKAFSTVGLAKEIHTVLNSFWLSSTSYLQRCRSSPNGGRHCPHTWVVQVS